MRSVAFLLLVASCEKADPPSPPPPPPPPPPLPAPLDLVLTIDMSKSMEETDIPRDRLDATKTALAQLIAASKRDRIGLVLYGQRAAVWAPLGDPELAAKLGKLQIGDVPELGTAAGDGLALAVDQVKGAKKKAIVVVGDGENNWVTHYDPDQAAAYAKQAGVKVYTIMVGSDQPDAFGMATDPTTLRAIADATGGAFYKATTPPMFADDIAQIRKLLDR